MTKRPARVTESETQFRGGRWTRQRRRYWHQQLEQIAQVNPEGFEVLGLVMDVLVDLCLSQPAVAANHTPATAQLEIVAILEMLRQQAPSRLFRAIDQALECFRDHKELFR